ncbi:MAG: AAA family ATPase [Cyanobacteria bacterium P01_F01_bin.116]
MPLLPFLLVTAGLAFSFSYIQRRFWGVWIGAVLTALGIENLGWQVLWVLPVTCVFYYRLLPEYLFYAPIPITPNLNFLSNVPYRNLSSQHFERWIKRLPPYTSELLWLPIPGHGQLLAKVFQSNSNLGLSTLQTMQASSLPGLSRTAKRALPDIIAGQLLQIEDIPSLQTLLPEAADQQSENLLKILLPTYYEIQTDENRPQQPSNSDLDKLFPRLQDIAQTVDATLQGSNYALRERGFESSLNQLQTLKATLPSLGLKSNEIKRWQPVIARWQNILELELQEQQKLSQGELLNPFRYGNPLKRSQGDLFKGRQHFADNIVRLLLDRNRPTIVLHGPRRCGKTSFLNNLPRLLPSDWLPIFVDIQSSAATADETSFLRSLARAIRRDSRSQGLQLPPVPERNAFLDAPYDTFETWLETVLDQLGDRQLLLNLDEFEKIGTAINQGKLSFALFDELRSLIQHWDQLGFIFSGVQTLDEIGPNWSSYFISVVPVEMLYLEPHEARDLLTNPDPEFALTYSPGLLDTILDLTQCHPNLLQLIGAALVTEANERHIQTATADMLEAAIPRAFTLGTSYFTNVWTEFTGDPTKPTEIRAGQIALKTLADGNQPTATDTATKAALRRMVRYHVLKEANGQYEFDILLIKRWVKERAILNNLA